LKLNLPRFNYGCVGSRSIRCIWKARINEKESIAVTDLLIRISPATVQVDSKLSLVALEARISAGSKHATVHVCFIDLVLIYAYDT
jgi:hypothetical protein